MVKKKIRNPIARMAIMGKGGVHEKTAKAKRQQQKQALKNKIRAEQFGSSFFQIKKPKHKAAVNSFEINNLR
jgi:hypothetical protein